MRYSLDPTIFAFDVLFSPGFSGRCTFLYMHYDCDCACESESHIRWHGAGQRCLFKINQQTQRNLRNAEVAAAMGMMSPLAARWRESQDSMLDLQGKASVTAAKYSAAIKTLQVAMQSLAIATGASLAMAQEISPGVIIGAALLLGKTLQPIQVCVGSWKNVVDARQQYFRLKDLLYTFPPEGEKMRLPPIQGAVTATEVMIIPPGAEQAILAEMNFELAAGTVTMVLGPSGTGKSSLIRAILGLWPCAKGTIRIDGADSHSFNRDDLGPQIGYLPQDIELFDGSVAENIARFGELNPDMVVEAAKGAGVHELILALPEGYDTVISGSGGLLSPGQRQRIALARAIYGRPKFVVLDEPNSNLDEAGELALNEAVASLKRSGSSVLLVSHRQTIVPVVDYLIFLKDGGIHEQGSKEKIIQRARAIQEAKQQQAAASAPENKTEG